MSARTVIVKLGVSRADAHDAHAHHLRGAVARVHRRSDALGEHLRCVGAKSLTIGHRTIYRPVNSGGRLAENAATPSR